MLRDDPKRPHRETVNYMRRQIKFGIENKSTEEVVEDLKALDTANEAYIRAKTEFATVNSDYTLMNMIGAWTRVLRTIWEMDDKYGSKE